MAVGCFAAARPQRKRQQQLDTAVLLLYYRYCCTYIHVDPDTCSTYFGGSNFRGIFQGQKENAREWGDMSQLTVSCRVEALYGQPGTRGGYTSYSFLFLGPFLEPGVKTTRQLDSNGIFFVTPPPSYITSLHLYFHTSIIFVPRTRAGYTLPEKRSLTPVVVGCIPLRSRLL